MKTYISDDRPQPESQIGAALESLAHTIHERRNAGEKSYTYRLLTGDLDKLLKKFVEEAHETTLAAKDIAALDAVTEANHDNHDAMAESSAASDEHNQARSAEIDHLRYEAGDVVYHLMVLLERCGISLDEFAAEMNSRMTEDEIALRGGVVMLKPEHVNRGHHEE